MQRSLRPPVSFTSISLIASWHIGQSGIADWIRDMIHAFIRRERKALSHRITAVIEAVMQPSCAASSGSRSKLLTLEKKLTKINEAEPAGIQFRTIALKADSRCYGVTNTPILTPRTRMPGLPDRFR
jgi:hypothetical protein